MAHTAAVFTLGTLVRKRIEKLRRKEKDVRVHNRRSALLWLGQDRAGRGWRRYFLDGVHPLYDLEVLFCCWLLVGQRFEVGVGGGRKRLNILGAYCPDDHEYVDRRYTDKNLNAQSLIELFTLLMARHPQTKFFRIYLDNARYHHAVVLKEWIAQVWQQRGVVFALKHLPAYSPNLNLIERLWKILRKLYFFNGI